MLYVVGLIGFIAGFVFGQMILKRMLAGKSREELINNKSLHWKFGTMNWLIALLAMAAAMMAYERWFLLP